MNVCCIGLYKPRGHSLSHICEMAKCHPHTNLLEVSVKVGTDTVCTMFVRNISDIVDITTLQGASVTLKTVLKEVPDKSLMREQESVCNETNVEVIENPNDYEEPTESHDDAIDSLLWLTARINENIYNGMIPHSVSICNTQLSVEDGDDDQPESGMVEDGTIEYSQWPLSPSLFNPQVGDDRMLRKEPIEHPSVVPKEPLLVVHDVAVQQKTGSELLGIERLMPNVRMLLLLRLNMKWVIWILAEPHEERSIDRWNMSRETEERVVTIGTYCALDRTALSSVVDTTQSISDQYCVVVFEATTSLINPAANVSWTVERKVSSVPSLEDNQAAAYSVATENQAFLGQMAGDSTKAVDTKASLGQGSVQSHFSATSKAMENQASFEQGPVDSQTDANPKAMEIRASLVQGSVDNQTAADPKAMAIQASRVQAPLDSQTDANQKAMGNRASFVQAPVDSQTDANPKAMEIQASLVQGSVDNQTAADPKAMENQASHVQAPLDSHTDANPKAMEIQASLVQGFVDNQTAADPKAMEIQASHVQVPVGSKTAANPKAMENRASLVQGSVDSHTDANRKAMENRASLVQAPVDSQTDANPKAMEIQASLVQGSVDNQTAADPKAMEIQAPYVQAPVDSQTDANPKAMENQASFEQGSVDSQTDADPKAMEIQASLVQGFVDNQNSAESKAMEIQASRVQGSVDNQNSAESKAMEIQACHVQEPLGSQTAADPKAMEIQAPLVQGSVDSQTAVVSEAMENLASPKQGSVDSQIAALSRAMETQASFVQGSVGRHIAADPNAVESQASHVQRLGDHQAATKLSPMENRSQNSTAAMADKTHASLMAGPVSGQAPNVSVVKNHISLAKGSSDRQNDTLLRTEVNQTSPAPDWAVNDTDSLWQTCENRSVPEPHHTGTEVMILKSFGSPCPRLSLTQTFDASNDTSPGVQDHMVVQETKAPITKVSFQDQIYSSNVNENLSNHDTCDTVLPGNGEEVSRHAVSNRTVTIPAIRKAHTKQDAMGLHQQDRRKRHRKTKAPSTLRRDRARTQQWIQNKKIPNNGEKKNGETSMTQNNSHQLSRQEERSARCCTACVGTLLEHAGNITDVINLKQNIVLALEPDMFHDETRTLYGAMVDLLPKKEEWQLTRLMRAPGTGPHETCVHNMIRELKAEGMKMGHLLRYFCQEETKRADIVKLMIKMHQCDFCTNTAADVI